MQTNFSNTQLSDPEIAEAEINRPQMRALRLLHRNLPDLCDARQRTRQSARTNIPDQGDAGKRPGCR